MASAQVLEVDRLLAPISDESPSGVELKDDDRASALYYKIKDARDTARTSERQLQMAWGEEDQVASIDPPNWSKVLELAETILTEHSKDLWVCAWQIEGLCREYGFAGLRDGFRVARGICENFWAAIHPVPDEDEGIAHTVSQLAGLNGEETPGALIQPIRTIPITGSGSQGPLSLADYVQALELKQLGDTPTARQRIERGAATLDVFEQTVRQTPAPEFREILDDIEQALEEFNLLAKLLDEKCGDDSSGYSSAPPTSQIRNAIEECRDRLKAVAGDKLAQLASAQAAAAPMAEGSTNGNGAAGHLAVGSGGFVQGGPATGAVNTRDDALRVLLLVADFFRRTEPHSILSHTLQQAVRWGRMSFPDLMKELIEDESVRAALFRRVGVPASGETEPIETFGPPMQMAFTPQAAPSAPASASAPAAAKKADDDDW